MVKIETLPQGAELVPGYRGGQGVVEFENKWRASVVCHGFSYGGELGLYELAIFYPEGQEPESSRGGICYDTPITNDVIGYIDPQEDLPRILELISKLPAYSADVSYEKFKQENAAELEWLNLR
jgi:hypothetical protein